MDRSKVICHMYLSIDGKIDGHYMDESGCDISDEYYDKTIWKMGYANANGRTTAEMYFAHENIDYSKYDTHQIDYSDNVIKSDYYWVIKLSDFYFLISIVAARSRSAEFSPYSVRLLSAVAVSMRLLSTPFFTSNLTTLSARCSRNCWLRAAEPV